MWRPAPSIWCWRTACMTRRSIPWPPGMSALRPSGRSGTSRPFGRPCARGRSRPYPRTLQLHPGAEGRRTGGLHQDSRRSAGGGEPGRAAVYLRRHHPEDQPGHHVPGAVGKPRQALRDVPPEGRAPGRGRRGHRGIRSPGGPCAPGRGYGQPGRLFPL